MAAAHPDGIEGAHRVNRVVCRGPMSFKQFLIELPDDVTPEQAQQRYDDYRAEFWGSEVTHRRCGLRLLYKSDRLEQCNMHSVSKHMLSHRDEVSSL